MNNYEVIHPSTYFPNLYTSRVTGGLELVPDDFEPWGTLWSRSITGLAQRDGKTCTLVFISASNFQSPSYILFACERKMEETIQVTVLATKSETVYIISS